MNRISPRGVVILVALVLALLAAALLRLTTGEVTATQAIVLGQFALVLALSLRMRQVVRQQGARDKRMAATLEGQSRKLDALVAGTKDAQQDAERRGRSSGVARQELRSLAIEHRETIREVTRWVDDYAGAEKRLWRERSDALIRQVEALHNLHRLVDVRSDVPHSRGWALSPDAVLTVVADVLRSKPRFVVECGSGTSSVWLGYAAEAAGGDTHVVCLEHDPTFARDTRRRLVEHGLDAYVEVRDAELVGQELDGETWPWYDPAAWSSLTGVGLLLVDGPPEGTHAIARYPALPFLYPRMSDSARVLVDDARRSDEQEAVRRWLALFPEFTATDLHHEKGAILLVRRSDADLSPLPARIPEHVTHPQTSGRGPRGDRS